MKINPIIPIVLILAIVVVTFYFLPRTGSGPPIGAGQTGYNCGQINEVVINDNIIVNQANGKQCEFNSVPARTDYRYFELKYDPYNATIMAQPIYFLEMKNDCDIGISNKIIMNAMGTIFACNEDYGQ